MRTRLGARRWTAGVSLAGLLLAGLTVIVGTPSATAAPVPDATEVVSPALSSLSPGRLDVFTRSPSGTLQYQYRPSGGSWTAVRDLGGALASQPSVASWAPGRFDVFARGTNGALLHRWFTTAGGWSGWEDMGGSLRSAPSAVSDGPDRLSVFIRASDDALWVRHFSRPGGWSGWQRIGGILTASPAAASWGPGRFDVFVRATDSTLRHTFYNGSWKPFENFGGVLTSQPAAAAVAPGRLDVAVRSTGNTMLVKSFARGPGWSGFVDRAGIFTSGPTALATGGDLVLGGRGTGAYYTGRVTPAGSWSRWQQIDVYLPVRRMGTWVDTLDYALNPAASVNDMRARGVRTLYLGTARFNGSADFFDRTKAGQWLDAAHAAGIFVVGWYVPAYGDMARDLRRTLAIATYVSPGGQRFDAVGVDIERLNLGPPSANDGEVSRATFIARSVEHLRQVRAGTQALLVAIVPPPFATRPSAQYPDPRWNGFNWTGIGAYSDVVMPMLFWTNRLTTSNQPFSATDVYNWTRTEIQRTVDLARRPVAVEGGVGVNPPPTKTPATTDRLSRFVDAVRDTRSLGGSHYDYAVTTNTAFWPILARLNS